MPFRKSSIVAVIFLGLIFFFACKREPSAVVDQTIAAKDSIFVNFNQKKFFPNIAFERFGVKDGLSSESISALMQDRRGFLWVGTDNGLNRFDGAEFKSWKNDPDDSTTVPAAGILDLKEDSGGRIWALFRGKGLGLFDPETGRCEMMPDSVSDHDDVNGIDRLALDENDRFWFSRGYFDAKKRVFKPHENLKNLHGLKMVIGPKNEIFCYSIKAIFRFDERAQNRRRGVFRSLNWPTKLCSEAGRAGLSF